MVLFIKRNKEYIAFLGGLVFVILIGYFLSDNRDFLEKEKKITIAKIERKLNLINGKAVEFSYVYEGKVYINSNFYSNVISNYYYVVFSVSEPEISWILFDYPSREEDYKEYKVYSFSNLPKKLKNVDLSKIN